MAIRPPGAERPRRALDTQPSSSPRRESPKWLEREYQAGSSRDVANEAYQTLSRRVRAQRVIAPTHALPTKAPSSVQRQANAIVASFANRIKAMDWLAAPGDIESRLTILRTYTSASYFDPLPGHSPIEVPTLPTKAEFQRRARKWREATAGYSLMTHTAAHPDYLRIIGMGPTALPWIFEELRDNGGRWYVALNAITDADPVADEDRGRRPAMRAAWLRWGRDHGWIE